MNFQGWTTNCPHDWTAVFDGGVSREKKINILYSVYKFVKDTNYIQSQKGSISHWKYAAKCF